jgi:hypothetical protein
MVAPVVRALVCAEASTTFGRGVAGADLLLERTNANDPSTTAATASVPIATVEPRRLIAEEPGGRAAGPSTGPEPAGGSGDPGDCSNEFIVGCPFSSKTVPHGSSVLSHSFFHSYKGVACPERVRGKPGTISG